MAKAKRQPFMADLHIRLPEALTEAVGRAVGGYASTRDKVQRALEALGMSISALASYARLLREKAGLPPHSGGWQPSSIGGPAAGSGTAHVKLHSDPEAPRFVVFYRGQLRQWIVTQLREHGPATAHQLGERMLQDQKKDTRDRRLLADVTRRIAKSFVSMNNARMVTKHQTSKRGENTWRLA